MRLSTLGNMGKAAYRTAFDIAERDAALRSSSGFDDAWQKSALVPGWFSESAASAFWVVIEEYKPQTVVEIGSYQGRSTTFLGLAMRHAQVTNPRLVAIDPHTGDRQHLERLGASFAPSLEMFKVHTAAAAIEEFIDLRVETSDAAAANWSDPIDLLFVDGWHSYDAVLKDGRNFASKLSENGMACFDDYGNYDEVRRAIDTVYRELNLTFYGVVGVQAWFGRPASPPEGLRAAIRVNAARRRLADVSRRRRTPRP